MPRAEALLQDLTVTDVTGERAVTPPSQAGGARRAPHRPAAHQARRVEDARTRRTRRCVVVVAGAAHAGETAAEGLARTLTDLGVATRYLGREETPEVVALAVAEEQADAVELCLGRGGVLFLRELLRELTSIGRRDVSIVIHRLD